MQREFKNGAIAFNNVTDVTLRKKEANLWTKIVSFGEYRNIFVKAYKKE